MTIARAVEIANAISAGDGARMRDDGAESATPPAREAAGA